MNNQKILNALGVKIRVLENTKCPDCETPKPNILYSVLDEKYHVVCNNCNHQAESNSFESALFQFEGMRYFAKADDVGSSLLDKI